MKLAPKLPAVIAEADEAVLVVAVAVVVVAAVVANVGTDNTVSSKKSDKRYCLFNNSKLRGGWHKITKPFCFATKMAK
jgi:hypothetical protein